MDVVIRDATPADAEPIARILNTIIEARIYTALDTPFTVGEERAFLERVPPRGIFHVAVSQRSGTVVGFQNVEPFAAYTRAFDHVGVIGTFVDLDRRRQGIGSRLFERTFAAARAKGYEKLFTFVRADNPTALAAYLRQGFVIVGTAQKHARIDGRYVDEVMIERALLDA